MTCIRHGFGPEPKYRCLIAEWDGKPAAFALFHYNFSTWRGQLGVYLEDLFVLPEMRGKGIGKALFQRLAQIVLEEDCYGIRWMVLEWNDPALKFYESLGAEILGEWETMLLRGQRCSGWHRQETVSEASRSAPNQRRAVLAMTIRIIGAGLAGCEAAWQCARRGVEVELYEMRPVKSTPAHQTDKFAELVCSNSLKSESENTAPWLLERRDAPRGFAAAADRAGNSRSRRTRAGRRPRSLCRQSHGSHFGRAPYQDHPPGSYADR